MNLSLTTLNRVLTYSRLSRYRTRFVRAIRPLLDRLMSGVRDEPYRVISRLGQRLEAAFEPTDVLPAIVQTVGESLKLPYVAIGLTINELESGLVDLEQVKNDEQRQGVCPLVADLWSAAAASYGHPPAPLT